MKTRLGFVSNSSSASFCVPINRLTAEQVEALLNYNKHSDNDYDFNNQTFKYHDGWNINLMGEGAEASIFGWTAMDNGDMDEYLKDCGIDQNLLHWEDLS